jgi:hypothetical protein
MDLLLPAIGTGRWKTEMLLGRTLFKRLFESELMPPGLPQASLAIWGIALVAAPGYLLAFMPFLRYGMVLKFWPTRLPGMIAGDQFLFIMLGMLALGFVALAMWDNVFPDRRDARILGVLPLNARTLVGARLGALTAFALLFCLGVSGPPAVVYGLVLWLHGGAHDPVRAIAGHLISVVSASLFVFFTVIAIQGLLLNVLGRTAARRLALLVQMLAVVVLLQAWMVLPRMGLIAREMLMGNVTTLGQWLPPVWFLALYRTIAGTPSIAPPGADPQIALYALVAVAVTAGVIALATGLLAVGHRRLMRMAIESPESGRRRASHQLQRAARAMAVRVIRDPIGRAVAGFTIRTAMRSRPHLMLLAIYVGVGATIVVSSLFLAEYNFIDVSRPSIALLSAPLVLIFLTTCGMRVVIAIPTEVRANWVFRAYVPDNGAGAVARGARAALIAMVVLPIAVAAGLVGATLWGGRPAVLHTAFVVVAGTLLVDLFLIGFRKVPFACTYFPGRSRARTLFPLYAMAFSAYAYGLAGLELALLNDAIGFAWLVGILLLGIGVLAFVRARDLSTNPLLRYEEEDPDAMFAGFSLSEGLAAQAVPPPVPHPKPRSL